MKNIIKTYPITIYSTIGLFIFIVIHLMQIDFKTPGWNYLLLVGYCFSLVYQILGLLLWVFTAYFFDLDSYFWDVFIFISGMIVSLKIDVLINENRKVKK